MDAQRRRVLTAGAYHRYDAAIASGLRVQSRDLVADYRVTHERPAWSDFRNGRRGECPQDARGGEAR